MPARSPSAATGEGERRPLAELRVHERAELIPEMSAQEYSGLLAEVRAHGVTTPLEVTADGTVVDGRHRLRAAAEVGLSDVPVRIVSPGDPVEHMLASALHRRHLSPSQRAALALDLDEYRRGREEALSRKRAGKHLVATLPQGPRRSRELGASLAGVCPRLIQDALAVREADPELFARVKAGELPASRTAKRVRQGRRFASLPSSPPLPQGLFDIVYADPPWRSQSPGSDYAPENHYPTMELAAIKALPVPAAKDALLFLWATAPLLPEALEVMEAWGFAYRTNITWVKDWIGLGRWVRHRHEHLLLGRRGSFPLPEEPDRPDSVFEAKRGRHSEKPVGFYDLIERMYPAATRVELFARQRRPGWEAWGNEAAA